MKPNFVSKTILSTYILSCSTTTSSSINNNYRYPNMPILRTIDRILPKTTPHWVGDGFYVYPVFSDSAFTKTVSPLLMFDYAAPKEFRPSSSRGLKGVGQHPHRGFETVTVAFQGEVEHHDNHGGHGIIQPGDVQWMTAGKGVVHQEYHSKKFTASGGTFEMAQLWVNLPKKHKMTKPRYQEILNAKIPVVDLDNDENDDGATNGATARLIAGKLPTLDDDEEAYVAKGPAKTYSPINLWDVSLPNKGSTVKVPYPVDHACMVFVRRGSVAIGGRKLGPQQVAILDNSEDTTTYSSAQSSVIELDVLKNNSAVLIMGGETIDEPIANMGPFVMNTDAELRQAVTDYRMGKF